MQILQLGNGKFMTVEMSWRDGGKDAEWAMIGGQRIRITERVTAPPEIFMNPEGFFYKDGKPVSETKDVQYLPEPWRSKALEFIGGKPEKLSEAKLFDTKEEAAIAATPKRKGGRPKNKVKTHIVIKDEASLREASGGIVI